MSVCMSSRSIASAVLGLAASWNEAAIVELTPGPLVRTGRRALPSTAWCPILRGGRRGRWSRPRRPTRTASPACVGDRGRPRTTPMPRPAPGTRPRASPRWSSRSASRTRRPGPVRHRPSPRPRRRPAPRATEDRGVRSGRRAPRRAGRGSRRWRTTRTAPASAGCRGSPTSRSGSRRTPGCTRGSRRPHRTMVRDRDAVVGRVAHLRTLDHDRHPRRGGPISPRPGRGASGRARPSARARRHPRTRGRSRRRDPSRFGKRGPSDGPASAPTRAPITTAMPPIFPSIVSTSPVCTPARISTPRDGRRRRSPRRTAALGPVRRTSRRSRRRRCRPRSLDTGRASLGRARDATRRDPTRRGRRARLPRGVESTMSVKTTVGEHTIELGFPVDERDRTKSLDLSSERSSSRATQSGRRPASSSSLAPATRSAM